VTPRRCALEEPGGRRGHEHLQGGTPDQGMHACMRARLRGLLLSTIPVSPSFRPEIAVLGGLS
jgi:hypothetical protein